MDNNTKTKQTVYNIFDSNDPSVSSFNSYLVAALKRKGIDVVFDKTGTKLEKGRFLGIKLVLVILSNAYMFSVECLENLVKLHEFLQERGHVGVPVFYNEGASVLKDQMEMCKELVVLEESYSVDQVTKWRRALVRTMDLQGHEYSDKLREESKFIEVIAQDVFEKLYPTEHIGIHKVLLELENLLCKQPWGLRTLAIFGKPGIGKTTLVKAALSKMSSGYDAYHFIIVSDEKIIELLSDEDFKEVPMEKFDLNNQDGEPCHRPKRVLIVLDDVKNAEDVEAFRSGFARFGPGSLLIITSRGRQVLEKCHVNDIYELKGLNIEDSKKLFRRCIFGEDVMDEICFKLAVKEIELFDGNPSTIRSYAAKLKNKKTENMVPDLGRIFQDLVYYSTNFTITLKQPFLFTNAHNYQSDIEKFPGLDISENMLSNLGAPYLDCNSLQQSFFLATSHSYLSDFKDLPLLNLHSHVLESLPTDLRIHHFGQDSVLACQLNKAWQGYKSFRIGHIEKLLSSEARKVGQIESRDCTRKLVTAMLEPQVLNHRGCTCIEVKCIPEYLRTIREFIITGQILEWRPQAHLCPLCNSANETASHIYFDFTFSWSVPRTIDKQIHLSPLRSWEDVLFALLNITRSKAKKILRGMEWQLPIYRSAQVHRLLVKNIISIVRKSRRTIASEIP